MKRLCACASVAFFACAVSTSAQESAAVRVIGASAFGNAALTPMIGGGLTFDRDDVVQVFGEAAMEVPMRDVQGAAPAGAIPTYVVILLADDEVNRVDRYAIGGVRLRHPTESPATFFVEFGGGAARTLSQFTGARFPLPVTRLFASAGGGVFVKATETFGIEAGYRYGRMASGSFIPNINKVYAAIAFKLY